MKRKDLGPCALGRVWTRPGRRLRCCPWVPLGQSQRCKALRMRRG